MSYSLKFFFYSLKCLNDVKKMMVQFLKLVMQFRSKLEQS